MNKQGAQMARDFILVHRALVQGHSIIEKTHKGATEALDRIGTSLGIRAGTIGLVAKRKTPQNKK